MSRPPAALLVVALAVAFGAASQSASAAIKVRPMPFQKGMTLVDWGAGGYPDSEVRAKLDYLKSMNVKSVTFIQTWTQATGTSTEVYSGRAAVPEENLVNAIRYARSLELGVVLRPYVDPSDGTWRGRIIPSSRDRQAWFRSYGDFQLRYAELAKREGVSVFVFGSEMGRTSRAYPNDWSALAAKVRAVFPGPVAYEANWGEVAAVKWLGAVDAIGLSAYNPICRRPTSSIPALVNSWKTRLVTGIRAVNKRFARPVFFSEIGYRPIAKACLEPWNTDWLAPLNTNAQRSLYEAALQVWWKQTSWFRGLHWWAMGARGVRKAPEDHDPRDPAMDRVAYWFGRSATGES